MSCGCLWIWPLTCGHISSLRMDECSLVSPLPSKTAVQKARWHEIYLCASLSPWELLAAPPFSLLQGSRDSRPTSLSKWGIWISGLGASRLEQGATGQGLLRGSPTPIHCWVPRFLCSSLGLPYAAKSYSLCVSVYMLSTGELYHLLWGQGMQGTLSLKHKPRPKGVKGFGFRFFPLSQYGHPPWTL